MQVQVYGSWIIPNYMYTYQPDPNITDKRQFKILAHNVKVILEERVYNRGMETYLECRCKLN